MVMIPQKKAPVAEAAKAAPVLPKAAAPAPAPAHDNTPGPAAAPAEAAAPAAAPAPAPAAVAVRPMGAVVVASRPQDVVAQTFKDAMRVDWNTLNRIQATNGNIVDVEDSKRVIGPEVVMELMSYQDNFQYSPGTDDPDDAQYVRYSDDGITFSTGEDVKEYMAAMEVAGYDKGKLGPRVVLAGNLVGGAHDGKLVQINLSPTSKARFDRFKFQVSIDVSKGKRQPDEARTMRLKCVLVSKGQNTWTEVAFDYANPPLAA